MDIIYSIVLLLLSLFAYSAGVISISIKFSEVKPQIIDLILMIFIWTGLIYSKTTFTFNKWPLILTGVIISIIIGIIRILPRRLSKEEVPNRKKTEITSRNLLKNLWHKWENLSKRIGNFQSRIILSLFFFLFVSPFALVLKIFSDPLKIKRRNVKSYWLFKRETANDLDQFRKQF